MSVLAFMQSFRELADFCLMLVADDYSIMQMFLNELDNDIALNIDGASYTFYQAMEDVALEVEWPLALHTLRR